MVCRFEELRRSRGFTLVELAVVIVIVGILAAFGVPRFLQSVERSKAAEAFAILATLQEAQERYHVRQGTYAVDLNELDVRISTPKYFTMGAVGPGKTGAVVDSWSQTLTRNGASAGFGPYTVTFTEEGFDKQNSTISGRPEINPMGS